MAEKLLIVLMNTDPVNSLAISEAFFQATVAASMEYEVEIVFTGRAGELARKGFAEKSYLQEGRTQSVYDLMKEAYEAGVKFKACSQAIEAWGDNLIPEIDETIGSAYLISEAMTDGTVTFTY